MTALVAIIGAAVGLVMAALGLKAWVRGTAEAAQAQGYQEAQTAQATQAAQTRAEIEASDEALDQAEDATIHDITASLKVDLDGTVDRFDELVAQAKAEQKKIIN